MVRQRAAIRIGLNVGLDGALGAAAVGLAWFICAPEGDPTMPVWPILWGAVLLIVAGLPFRLAQQHWRFAGSNDLLGVVAASIATASLFPVALHLAGVPLPSPAFPLAHVLGLTVLLSLPRVGYRLMREGAAEGVAVPAVLLIGAGEPADLFLRALAADRAAPYRAVGVLSLGRAQTGRRINGVPILGAVEEAAAVLARMRAAGNLPATLVVTAPELDGARLAAVIEVAAQQGVRVARAPRLTVLDDARPDAALLLRPVAIEELLNRPQVPLDQAGIARLIAGRRVLVTGAGGTIGAELARQVAALAPAALVLLDNGEFALWQIDTELAEIAPAVARVPVIADVRDAVRIQAICAQYRPELVFHAAALKHVPMVEAHPLEGLLTNAVGTAILAEAARAAGALAMVLVSTDKAVNPSSVMGASKRVAEIYCQALDIVGRRSNAMRCITVRFGNVLGSTGSVVPLFQRQLARGGPLTVTHPDMLRYFMTVREAVGLVLQASLVGVGAPDFLRDGGIFVLDMGAPVKILDLARQMIRLAGLRPERDIEIRFTGLRPGEKLFEELFHGHEPTLPTPYPGLLLARPRTTDAGVVRRAIDDLAAACRAGDTALALAQLGRLIPEFTPMIEDRQAS